MARKQWKQPISVTLSKDAIKAIRELSSKWKMSRSAVVERAITFYRSQIVEEVTINIVDDKAKP
jgi:hypothetical protein